MRKQLWIGPSNFIASGILRIMTIFKPSSSLLKAFLLLLVFLVSSNSALAGGTYTVTRGNSLTLTWSITGASNCTPDTTYAVTNPVDDGWYNFWRGTNPQPSSGTKTLKFYAAPGSYTFSCTAGGVADTATVQINDCSGGAVWEGNNVNGGPACMGPYTITSSAGSGGSISPLGAGSVTYNTSKTFTISPSVGYAISAVTVDGSPVGAVSTYTFNNVAANHTISASFTPLTYTLTPSAGTGGSISPGTPQVVNYGGNVTFNINPSGGYSIGDVKVDGSSIGVVSSKTFSNVTADHSISATFLPYCGATTLDSGKCDVSSTPSGSTSGTCHFGYVGACSFTCNSGSWGVPSSDTCVVGSCANGANNYPTCNTCAPGSDYVGGACHAELTITVSAGSGGSISPGTVSNVIYGTNSPNFTITASAGYTLSHVYVDSIDTPSAITSPVAGSYQFTNVTGNHTLSATFSPIPVPVVTATPYTLQGGTSGAAYYGEYAGSTGNKTYISWTATGNPASCDLYKNGSLDVSSVSSPYYIPQTEAITGSVQYYVKCTNGGGPGTSNTVTFTVPPPVTNPQASCPSPGSPLTFTWSTSQPGVYIRAAKGVLSSGDIYTPACTGNGGNPLTPPNGLCQTVVPGNAGTYTFSPSTPGAEYGWYIQSRDAYGNWSTRTQYQLTCASAPSATFTTSGLTCTVPAGVSPAHCSSVPTISWTSSNVTGETFTDCGGGVYAAFDVPPTTSNYNNEYVPLSGNGPTSNGCYRIYYGKYYDNTSLQAAVTSGTSWVISTSDQLVTASCASGSTWGVASQTCLADPAIGSFTNALYGFGGQNKRDNTLASAKTLERPLADKVFGASFASVAAAPLAVADKAPAGRADLAYAYGAKVQLTWGAITGGGTLTCTITNNKDGTSIPVTQFAGGSTVVGPLTQTTVYTLTCSNGVGPSASKTTTVSIDAANCSATTLSNCDVTQTVAGGSSGSCHQAYSGACSYTCKSDGTWNTNAGQYTNSCTADTVTLYADGNTGGETVLEGSAVKLSWTSVGAQDCWSTGAGRGADGSGFVAGGATSKANPPGVSVNPIPPSPVGYGIDCYDSKGYKFSSQVSITLISPTLTITATPSRVPTGGGSTTINWSANDVTSCSVSKNGGSWTGQLSADGSNNVNGNKTDSSVTTQTTYKLTCTSLTGKVYNQSVVVNVGSTVNNF